MESLQSNPTNNENLDKVKDFIGNLQPEDLLHTNPDIKLKPYVQNDFTYIQNEEYLKQFSTDIQENHKYIGVDIEQTNKHTYQGSICLIQIAIPDKNYIIDVISLRDVVKKYIAPIFQDKNIVKIFYAGGSDLQWLDRDFGIFVVNIFDIYTASYFLEKNRDQSLAALLEQYCKHPIDKKKKKEFQTSDWYHRPLTEEQLNYAILDAHYLIYLRNILLQKMKVAKDVGAISSFVKQMQNPCLKSYESKAFNLKQCVDFFDKEIVWYKDNDEQFSKRIQITGLGKDKRIFLTLCKLRDEIAREADKSPDEISHLKALLAFTVENLDIASSQDKDGLFISDEKFSLPLSYKAAFEKIFQGEGLIDFDENAMRKKQENKNDKKLERRKIVEEKFTLKKSPYENCEILAPDGELISRTNKKKVQWYLEKGLGTLIKEDPPTVRLNFEPKSRNAPYVASFDVDKDLYLKHHRLNRCVVCGQEESLSRFHIIPSLYRQHLPLKVKDHNAHDILITCFRCQEKAHGEADKRKSEIAKKFDVPLVHFDKSHDIKLSVTTVQKSLSTYQKHQDVISKNKKKKLKRLIREDFEVIQKCENLSEEAKKALESFKYKENGQVKIDQTIIDYFANIKNFKEMVASNSNKDFKNLHGKLVVDKLITMEDVSAFIEDWRMFFIDTMDPQFLPHDWHVVLQKKAHLQKM